jgi:hypothetical protein
VGAVHNESGSGAKRGTALRQATRYAAHFEATAGQVGMADVFGRLMAGRSVEFICMDGRSFLDVVTPSAMRAAFV